MVSKISRALFTTLVKGLVPPSGGGTTNFLRADGTWALPGGTPSPLWRLAARWHDIRTFVNIGTPFVNVYNLGANGQRQLVDFTGFTEFRLIVHWNHIGTGPQDVAALDQLNPLTNVLWTLTSTGAGEKELDSAWQPIIVPLFREWPVGEQFIVIQARSITPADDPVFRGASLFLR